MKICCPHCFTANNVPGERLGDGPKCGKCGEKLFPGQPAEVSEPGFHKLIGNTDIPVIVDCWAEWCGPCKAFAPTFKAAAARLEPRFRLAKVDTENNGNLAANLQIRSIPTLLVFKNGQEAGRVSGAMPLEQFIQWAEQFS